MGMPRARTVNLSYIALNRIVEKRAAEDDAYRRTLQKRGRPVLSHGRGMPDEALLAKLRSLGFDAEPDLLSRLFTSFLSAQEMAETMICQAKVDIPDSEVDWVWIAVTCLWERWHPQLPNMEMVDDKMQAGYAALEEQGSQQACRLWLDTWRAILEIMDRGRVGSLDEFDDRFGGTQCVFNWVQDFEMELHNAGLEEPQFFRERISLCETMLCRFSADSLLTDGFRIALAESYFDLESRDEGDRLFRGWLEERPQWGQGWRCWSQCYWPFGPHGQNDATRAEEILKEGLGVPGVDDKPAFLEQLAQLYEETDRSDQAEAVRREIEPLRCPKAVTTATSGADRAQIKQTYDFGDEGLPLDQFDDFAKSVRAAGPRGSGLSGGLSYVGRNAPCPCGSGKKYKKCCGKPGRGPRRP